MHVIEPRISGNNDQETDPNDSNDALREIWGLRTYISAGGYDKEEAAKLVDSKGGLVSFGRHFLANVCTIIGPLCLFMATALTNPHATAGPAFAVQEEYPPQPV